MRDQIRQAVIARAEKRWARVQSPSFIGRLLRPLFGGKLDAVLVAEHSAVDPDSLLCQGNVIAAWRLDESGLNEIDPSQVVAGPVSAKKCHVLHFHIADDDSEVIANEMEGPDRGTLIQFKVKPQASGVKLAVRRTSLLLGGSSIG